MTGLMRQVGFDQLDTQLPLDVPVRDEEGRTVPLGITSAGGRSS